jgi:hypothetical protein
MEQKIREVQDYLKSKILKGEFEVGRIDVDIEYVSVLVDGLFEVTVYVSRCGNTNAYYSTGISLNEEEKGDIKSQFSEIVDRGKKDLALKKYEALKRELEEMMNESEHAAL